MTANSTPPPANLDDQNSLLESQASTSHPAPASQAEMLGDSPEILRWRADILMDEMMLGAVDGLAHEVANGHSVDGAHAENGIAPTTSAPLPDQPPRQASSTADTIDFGGAPPSAHSADADVMTTASDTSQASAEDDETWWQHPFRTPPVTHTEADPPHSAAPTGYFVEDAASVVSSTGDRPHGDPAAKSINSGADANADPSLLRPPSALQLQSSATNDVAPSDVAGADRVRAGAAMDGGRKRSNLLPRASDVNTEALWREIEEMRAEIDSVIPENHEWSVRSRHLLDKAEAILRQSPDRTAEVEYYLNQVRGIRERVRQSFGWSQLYVRRLNVYLLAWIGFAGIGALGCFLYRRELANFFMLLTGMAGDNFLIQALPLWLSTIFLGALGGALGARYTMHRHKRLEHGFFDRKYSLRGLLLPLLAAFVALVLFIPFGLIAYLAPVSDAIALTLVLIAMLLAFLYGLFQQKLYGIDS